MRFLSSRAVAVDRRLVPIHVGRGPRTVLCSVATFVVLLLPIPWGSAPGAAQQDLFEGAEVSLGVGVWTGRQADLFRPGFRALLALAAEAAPRRRVLLEALYGRFSPRSEGTVVTESSVRVAARLELEPTRGWVPYLQGRVGYHRLSGTGAGSGATQTGLLLGPEVGAEWPISDHARLMGAVEGAWIWYGDVGGSEDGASGTGGYALRFGVRIGVSFRRGDVR
jgi:hypothetical protein